MYIQYEMPMRLEKDDFTGEGALRASRVLHAFQEIAKAHATAAGLGFDELIAKDLIWVVARSKFRMLGKPEPEREYRLRSFPRRTGSFIYDRDFHVLDPEGGELIVGTSQWCIVNAVTRHVERTGLDFPGEYNPEPAMPEGIERIRPKELRPVGRHVVTEDDLDENMHTNNCRYADMALEILGIQSVGELTMNFVSETRLGDEIELCTGPDGIAAGRRGGNLVFAAMAR